MVSFVVVTATSNLFKDCNEECAPLLGTPGQGHIDVNSFPQQVAPLTGSLGPPSLAIQVAWFCFEDCADTLEMWGGVGGQ